MTVTETVEIARELEGVGRSEFVDKANGYRAYHYTPPDGVRVRLPSVTTVLGAVVPKHALLDWYEARGAEGAVTLERHGVLEGVDPDQVIEVVRGRGMGAKDHARQAAGRGVSLHAILEDYCRTGDFPNPIDYPEDYRGYIRALARWILKADPEPIATERLVCHPEHGYAGRYDLRALAYGSDALIDLKTNRKGTLYPEAALQLAGYAEADERCGASYPERLLLVALGPDGQFTEGQPNAGIGEAWKRALAHYHSLKAVAIGPVEVAA
jgi:hypothetical protein